MTKKLLCIVLIFALTCVFVSCGHTHSFGEWETVKEATLSMVGMKTQSCACGETKTEEIPKLASATISTAELISIVDDMKDSMSSITRFKIAYYEKVGTEFYLNEVSVVNDGNFKCVYLKNDIGDVVEQWYGKVAGSYKNIVIITDGPNMMYQENDAYVTSISDSEFNVMINRFSNRFLEIFRYFNVVTESFDNSLLKCTGKNINGKTIYTIDCSDAGENTILTLEVVDNLPVKCSVLTEDEIFAYIENEYDITITMPSTENIPIR